MHACICLERGRYCFWYNDTLRPNFRAAHSCRACRACVPHCPAVGAPPSAPLEAGEAMRQVASVYDLSEGGRLPGGHFGHLTSGKISCITAQALPFPA